ncbi:MAG: RnfABCDGE type electron transport complex subunit G [Elusimicrobiota bacterium]
MIKTAVKFALLLAAYCVLAAAGLSIVYQKTKPEIEKNKTEILKNAMKEILPDASTFEAKSANVFFAFDSNRIRIGTIIKSSPRGYSGVIELLAGLDTFNCLVAVKVISQTETPGLGTRISEDVFLKQFIGKNIKELGLKNDGGTIEAVTGATVSSRAVLRGVVDGVTHPTPVKHH